jgi:hypothetical protein
VGNDDGFAFSCYAQADNHIYAVGNEDGFAFSCYAQADNPFFNIYAVGNEDGFAFNSVGSLGNEVPVPIELVFFDAKCNNGKVHINWATASETNNDYFTIERSAYAINWQIIGTVDGAGNSNSIQNYSTIDENPYKGVSYYRLKQTDFDGKFEYFNLVAVNCDNINLSKINIYPNPNNGHFIIEGTEPNANLIILNQLGKKIITQKISSEKMEIDLSNLPNGIYFVQISSEKESVTRKISINQ